MCANRENIDKFFVNHKKWLEQWHIKYHPNHIWNVDECGIPDVPKEVRVLGQTGERAFQTVSGEKAVNSTFLTFISAGGLACPPLLILKGTRVQPDWREATPTGYMIRSSLTGYINQDLFAQYGERFVQFLELNGLLLKGKNNPRKNMILLDMHKTHLFNIKFMRLMHANNIEVCSFPPHCTHVLQPLDDVPFAYFKNIYNDLLLEQNYKLAAKKLGKPDLFKLLIPAFTAAMSHGPIAKGFANTGVYPWNPNAPKPNRVGPSEIFDKCE